MKHITVKPWGLCIAERDAATKQSKQTGAFIGNPQDGARMLFPGDSFALSPIAKRLLAHGHLIVG